MGTPSSPAMARLPKVPSLLFDMELEDGAKSAHSSDEMDLHLVEAELKRFLRPCSASVAALTQLVESSVSTGSAPLAALDAIHMALQQAGYRVCVRRALGGGEGSLCLHNLRHTFLSVACEGIDQLLVVDPAFAEQFRIAKPTGRYETILACLPSVMVLPEDRLPPLVTFLCAELASAFKACNTVVPPWRQASSMLSKWQPRRSLDLPSSAHIQPELQQSRAYAASAHGSDARVANMHGSRPAPGKVVMSAAVHIKPMMMEPPQRVYGGFGASFGGGYINMAT